MLYNDGIIPATVKLEMSDGNSNSGNILTMNGFTLVNGDKYVTLESKQTSSFDVTFKPGDTKYYNQEIRLKINNNHFENTVISATGEGYTR